MLAGHVGCQFGRAGPPASLSSVVAEYERFRSSSSRLLQTVTLDFGRALNALDRRFPSRTALAAIPQRLEFVRADGVAVPVVDRDSCGVDLGSALGLAPSKAGGTDRGRKTRLRPRIRRGIRDWLCRLLDVGAANWLSVESGSSSRRCRDLRGSHLDAVGYQGGHEACSSVNGEAEWQQLTSWVERTTASLLRFTITAVRTRARRSIVPVGGCGST